MIDIEFFLLVRLKGDQTRGRNPSKI